MANKRNVEARRRARKARKRSARRAGEVRAPKRERCRHVGFDTRMAAVSWGVKTLGVVRVPRRCPRCGKFFVE